MHDGKTYMAEVITLNFMQTVVMQIHVKYTHEDIKLRMHNCNILIWKWFVNIYEYVELKLWSDIWWVKFVHFIRFAVLQIFYGQWNALVRAAFIQTVALKALLNGVSEVS